MERTSDGKEVVELAELLVKKLVNMRSNLEKAKCSIIPNSPTTDIVSHVSEAAAACLKESIESAEKVVASYFKTGNAGSKPDRNETPAAMLLRLLAEKDCVSIPTPKKNGMRQARLLDDIQKLAKCYGHADPVNSTRAKSLQLQFTSWGPGQKCVLNNMLQEWDACWDYNPVAIHIQECICRAVTETPHIFDDKRIQFALKKFFPFDLSKHARDMHSVIFSKLFLLIGRRNLDSLIRGAQGPWTRKEYIDWIASNCGALTTTSQSALRAMFTELGLLGEGKSLDDLMKNINSLDMKVLQGIEALVDMDIGETPSPAKKVKGEEEKKESQMERFFYSKSVLNVLSKLCGFYFTTSFVVVSIIKKCMNSIGKRLSQHKIDDLVEAIKCDDSEYVGSFLSGLPVSALKAITRAIPDDALVPWCGYIKVSSEFAESCNKVELYKSLRADGAKVECKALLNSLKAKEIPEVEPYYKFISAIKQCVTNMGEDEANLLYKVLRAARLNFKGLPEKLDDVPIVYCPSFLLSKAFSKVVGKEVLKARKALFEALNGMERVKREDLVYKGKTVAYIWKRIERIDYDANENYTGDEDHLIRDRILPVFGQQEKPTIMYTNESE